MLPARCGLAGRGCPAGAVCHRAWVCRLAGRVPRRPAACTSWALQLVDEHLHLTLVVLLGGTQVAFGRPRRRSGYPVVPVPFQPICASSSPSATGRTGWRTCGLPRPGPDAHWPSLAKNLCFSAIFVGFIHPPDPLLRLSSLVFCTRLTAPLRHVAGFPDLGLLRGLCPTSGIGRRLAYPVAGEPNVVPKFTQIASSCRLRPCLYAWLGSLPRSSSGNNRL